MYLAHEPVHSRQHILTGGVEGAFAVVGHDDHAALVGRVASCDKELGL